ncbi:MAG: Chemotaxis response regulator protein-glutamate methylesterase [Anaerolineae bacterium]|nr:Chemotaxis response regulator protein-glutamate methylesterase [Anaerolineae bacterium]
MTSLQSVPKNQQYNILVIEDFPSWQRSFRRFLRDEPFNVMIAANPRDALRQAKCCRPDVLILDVNLSGVPYNMDGLRLAEQIWRWHRDVKIIIVSGCSEWLKRLSAYRFAPSFIIEKKNFDQDDLVDKIYSSINYRPPLTPPEVGRTAGPTASLNA